MSVVDDLAPVLHPLPQKGPQVRNRSSGQIFFLQNQESLVEDNQQQILRLQDLFEISVWKLGGRLP